MKETTIIRMLMILKITAAVNNSVPIVEIKEKQAISLSSLESGFYTMHLKDPSGKKGIGVSAVDLVDPTSSFFYSSIISRSCFG